MKLITLSVFASLLCLMPLAHASEPPLWAFDVGPAWGEGVSVTVSLDPFSTNAATFPPGWNYLMDASYDLSTSLLYVSGGFSTAPSWWYQNTIAIYSGGPGGLEFISSSNAGMGGDDGYHWLGGIALMDESLYAVGWIGFDEGNVLLRIDNPGTAGQTVTQVGPAFGNPGIPFNLCPDGRGSLFSMFRPASSDETTLYRIDPTTGSLTALHTYPNTLIDGYVEGLTLSGNSLYGATTNWGRLIRFDLDTYEGTVLGELGLSELWTGLVTIPEPSMMTALGLGFLIIIVGVRMRTSRF